MHRMLFAAFAISAVAALSPSARAGVVDNTSLTNPPGVYFGSGNANDGFTVDTNGAVEVGLSAIVRFTPPYITPTGNVYIVPLGDTTVPSKTGSAWGVDFSINLQASSGGSLILSNIDPVLIVTDERTGFTDTVYDFTSFLTGNVCYNGTDDTCNNPTTDYAIQNSEPGSLLSGLGDAFNDQVADTYIFTLDVYDCSGEDCTSGLLASDTIVVDAVPEPTSLALFGTALAGLGFLYRRRSSKKAA